MSGYVVASYTISDQDGYAAYPPAVMPVIAAHGGEVLVADFGSEVREGTPGHVTVVLRFPSKEAAQAWYDSDEYQAIAHHRTDNSEGSVVVCDGFGAPE